jgi:hypothetical protein
MFSAWANCASSAKHDGQRRYLVPRYFLTRIRYFPLSPTARVRRFKRAVTSEMGVADGRFLGRGRHLGRLGC